MQRLSVFEKNILRKIFGPTKEDNGIWRIKTNKELDELIKHQNIINYVKSQTLSWFGHVNRMPETSIARKIYKWKPLTSRPVGRPKFRWVDAVRNDMKRMKLIKWTEQVQDRLEWKVIVEKAKTVPELLCRRKKLMLRISICMDLDTSGSTRAEHFPCNKAILMYWIYLLPPANKQTIGYNGFTTCFDSHASSSGYVQNLSVLAVLLLTVYGGCWSL
jgi:hypothetical protein